MLFTGLGHMAWATRVHLNIDNTLPLIYYNDYLFFKTVK